MLPGAADEAGLLSPDRLRNAGPHCNATAYRESNRISKSAVVSVQKPSRPSLQDRPLTQPSDSLGLRRSYSNPMSFPVSIRRSLERLAIFSAIVGSAP